MNIQDFHAKSTARAKELAEKLGVTLDLPDASEVEARAKKRLSLIAKYNENKEAYDSVLNKLLDMLPAEEVQSIIKKLLSTKN